MDHQMDTNWEKIDTVNNSGMEDVNFKTYNYTVDKVGSYRYYKLDIRAGIWKFSTVVRNIIERSLYKPK